MERKGVCILCNDTLYGKRKDAKYCSNKCRHIAFLERKHIGEVVPIEFIVPNGNDTSKFALYNVRVSSSVDIKAFKKEMQDIGIKRGDAEIAGLVLKYRKSDVVLWYKYRMI